MAEVKEITDYSFWDRFVGTSPQGSIFCSTVWLRLYDEPFRIYGVFRDGALQGGICGFEKDGFKSGFMPLTPFQGVLVMPQSNAKPISVLSLQNSVTLLLAAYLKEHYQSVQISNHYNLPDIRPFKWLFYRTDIKYTYVINLRDINNLWTLLDKDTRYEILNQKAEITEQPLKAFDELYTYTFKRKGMERPVSPEFMQKFFQAIPALIWGTDSAMTYMMFYNKMAYYILGASDGTGSAGVLWESLCRLSNLGYKEVDLAGCNNEFIDRFKRGFGGELKPYYTACL